MQLKPTAVLILEDGRFFKGYSFGATGITTGELCFNTGMTGYQEILTDPSYCRQVVIMTSPHIGNTGINPEDIESERIQVAGFVIREETTVPSNWRSVQSLGTYLQEYDIVGIQGVDTRALTRHIRDQGAMNCIISSTDQDVDRLKKKLVEVPSMQGLDLAREVTCAEPYKWEGIRGQGSGVRQEVRLAEAPAARSQKLAARNKFNVAAIDYGIKWNILRLLESHGCRVTVYPAQTPAVDILASDPDGIFLSNGPGDPGAVSYGIETVKQLLGQKPIFGICLGHQILALALGAKTYKLKFGHRGINHPVKNLKNGTVEITSQNHGFAVEADSLPGSTEITHVNLNDDTLEGFRCRDLPAFSVQYHPEASPGPHDSRYLFEEFVVLMNTENSLD